MTQAQAVNKATSTAHIVRISRRFWEHRQGGSDVEVMQKSEWRQRASLFVSAASHMCVPVGLRESRSHLEEQRVAVVLVRQHRSGQRRWRNRLAFVIGVGLHTRS